jgi:hypothetical protein
MLHEDWKQSTAWHGSLADEQLTSASAFSNAHASVSNHYFASKQDVRQQLCTVADVTRLETVKIIRTCMTSAKFTFGR